MHWRRDRNKRCGSGHISKWQRKGVDPITFDASGDTIACEVMNRPIKAPQALGKAKGNRIGPQLAGFRPAATARCRSRAAF